MQDARILDYLSAAILDLKLDGIERRTIVRPNELVDLADAPLYFEVGVAHVRTRPETERSVVRSCVGTIAIVARRGVGSERVDAIADGLTSLFEPHGRFHSGGTLRAARFGSNAVGESRVYVVGVERTDPTIAAGRFKIVLNIQLEIYEEYKK